MNEVKTLNIDELLDGIDWGESTVTVESIRAEDKRAKCDCPMPFVRRKWHRALGTFVELRLCCMARLLEEKLGLPEGTVYKVFEFEPTMEWDEMEVVQDGKTGEMRFRGEPPKWLKQRMDKKGIRTKK